MGPSQVLPLQFSLDQGVMSMKENSTLLLSDVV